MWSGAWVRNGRGGGGRWSGVRVGSEEPRWPWWKSRAIQRNEERVKAASRRGVNGTGWWKGRGGAEGWK